MSTTLKSTAAALLAIVVIAAGWMFLSGNSRPVASQFVETDEIDPRAGIGSLDGLSFVGMIGPKGQSKDVEDRYVFANGTFVSKECELRCDYPARPYFERSVGNRTQFVSETRCPFKDANIVWRGFVEGDKVEGVATWTIRRWYWTVEKKFAFSGQLSDESEPIRSSQ